MTGDPLSDIENEKGQRDLGVTAHRIYAGARGNGASRYDAFLIVAAWFYGAMKDGNDQTRAKEEEEENEK